MSGNQPEELARVQNPKKECENCKELFTARNPKQKYCIACRPIVKKQHDRNYYDNRGSYQRKRKRRLERAKRDSVPRDCATKGCPYKVTGTLHKKYCNLCRTEQKRSRDRKYYADRRDRAENIATGAETRGDSTETNEPESTDTSA